MIRMRSGLNLGRIFGIQLRIHFSWFIIFALVTVSLVYPDWADWRIWAIGIVASLLFFASVLAHELSHSLVGRANGIEIKSITLFIFGGMAQMTREAKQAGAEFKMAAAGPACSLVLGGLFALLWFFIRDMNPLIATMFLWLGIVNGALALFNLIPGFPLDGGRVFRSILWRVSGDYQRATRIATRVGQVVAWCFIAGGIVLLVFFQQWINGIWLAFIGWFLLTAASNSHRQARWQNSLRGFTASQVMTPTTTTVPPDISVKQLVQNHVLPTGRRFFLVVEENRVKGIVTLSNIKSLPQPSWETTPVAKIMLPINRMKVARPEEDALSIMEAMAGSDINQIPVVSEGRIIGVITRENLIRFLRTRSDLGV